MVQAALYQLFLERKCGEYELPEGASLIACGNRDADRAVVHRMPTPLSNRLVHLEIRVDARDWCTLDAIVTYATRLRREVGESLVGACVRREPALQRSPAFIRWAAAKTQ